MDFAKELKQRVDDTKSLLESAKKAAAKARAEEEMLADELAAYQRILEAELRRSGHVQHNEVPQTPRDFELSPALGGDEDVNVNKVRVMRELIVENRSRGSTASTIMEALKSKGVKCPPTYVYSALSRMKKKGLIVTRRGKLFPSNSLTTSDGSEETASG